MVAPFVQKTAKYSEQEEKLFRELDKGIDDMENGNTIPHEDAMKQLHEKVKNQMPGYMDSYYATWLCIHCGGKRCAIRGSAGECRTYEH